MNAKDWWEYYIEGKIIRRDDTSLSIISTLEDWRDGKRSMMARFIRGEPVTAKSIRREIEKCVHANTLAKEVARLAQLEVWIIRESAVAIAAKELREAREAFGEAAHDAGLNAYAIYKIGGAAA